MKMKSLSRSLKHMFRSARTPVVLLLIGVSPLYAQGGSPWEDAVSKLAVSFTGPIARGLALVCIVIGGLTMAFGDNDNKRMVSGMVFGLGAALGAAQLILWLFGV